MRKDAWKRMLAFVLAFTMVVCDAGLSNLVYAAEDEAEAEVVSVEALASDEADTEDEDAVAELDAETYLKEQLTAAWDAGLSYVDLDADSYEVSPELLDEVYEDYLTYNYKYFYVYEGYRISGYDNDGDGSVDQITTVWITYGLEDGLYGTVMTKDEEGNLVYATTTDEEGKSVYETEDLTETQLSDIESMQDELTAVIEAVVAGADSGWTDVEKALYLNDYLAENCQYDQNAYEQDNTTERMPFTIYGALVNQICVCQGYARAFVILANALDLEAELVDSASLGHEWNAVKIDGIWYMLDVTWDDPVKTTRVSTPGEQVNDTIGKLSHEYFLKSLDYFCDGTLDQTTHLDEDDWTFTGGLSASDITGDAYDSFVWDDVRTPFIYDSSSGTWYAMVAPEDEDATSTSDLDTTGTVYAFKFALDGAVVTYTQTELFTVKDVWQDETLGYLKIGQYGLDYYDGCLYYTTTDTIYVYDIEEGESTYYYGLTDAQLECGDIYGIQIDEDGTIYAQLSKSYNNVGTVVALCNVENGRESIANATITLSAASFGYIGEDQKPAVTVTVTVDGESETLEEGTDYRLEYPEDMKNAGTKTITVTGIGEYNGTATVTYTIEKVNISSSDVNGMASGLEMTYGQTRTPYTTYTDSDGNSHSLTTSKNQSGDESIVTIIDGEIEAVGVGSTTIYYYIGEDENYNYIELPVTVSRANQTVSTVGNSAITYGLSATVSASTTGDGEISFASSDTSVAYVETQSNGTYKLITAGVGEATITVTASQTAHYNSDSASFVVTVNQASQSLSIKTQGSTSIYAGDKTTWAFASTGDGTITYKSSDTSVATVSSSGVVTGVSAGTVKITAVANANSNYTASTAATVTMLILPAATSSISLSSASTGVKITWKEVAGADGYYIYRGTSSNPFAQVTSGSTVTYTDTNSKTSGTTYTYRVTAYMNYSSGVVLGKESSSKSIKYLSQGSISSLTNAASGVTVKWSKVTGASGYYIYRGSTKVGTVTSGSTTSWTDTAVKSKSGTTYKYYVVPYSGSYTGAKSSAKSIKRLTQGKVSSLTNVSSGVTVKWSKVSGASGYYIYRGSTQVKKITSGSTTSWTDTGVKSKNGTTYTYYVVPYSGSYKGAKSSGVKTVRLTAVTLSSVKNSSSKAMTVTYKKNSKATGYVIEYSTSKSFTSSTTKSVTIKSASTLSKKITSLTKNKTYYVRVKAYKTVSGTKYYSAYSSTKSVKISK